MDGVQDNQEKINQEIEAIEKKHGLSKVFRIEVPMDDEGKDVAVAFLKKPNRNVMAASMSFAESDPFKSNEILLKGCWLEGDERIQTDDDAFLSAQMLLQELISFRKGRIDVLKKK